MIGLFQRLVLHNFGLKVLSLLLASGLWFLISRDEQPAEVALRAPIVFQHVPPQLEISSESIQEAQIRVREVEVHPRVTGNFAPGEQIVKVDADPLSITITGPRHHVEKIDAATTDPIDATGTRGSAVFNTNVYVADPLVQVVQPTSIRVTVLVQKVGTSSAH